jgi:SnoaL-like polyketide cyclase
VELVHIFRVRDGKIVEHWAVRDDLGLMKQLGVVGCAGYLSDPCVIARDTRSTGCFPVASKRVIGRVIAALPRLELCRSCFPLPDGKCARPFDARIREVVSTPFESQIARLGATRAVFGSRRSRKCRTATPNRSRRYFAYPKRARDEAPTTRACVSRGRHPSARPCLSFRCRAPRHPSFRPRSSRRLPKTMGRIGRAPTAH